jgi:hypothetical protein
MGSIVLVPELTIPSGASFTQSFVIPTMPVGTYTIKVTTADGLTNSATLTVTKTTTVTVTPSSVSPGASVVLQVLTSNQAQLSQ